MQPFDRFNDWLDQFPRVRFATFAQPTPAFRACGIAGFYLAIVVTLATGLGRGRDLAVLALLCAVCGCSFYAYAHARRWLVGRETIVLLEHVWFALACAAGALAALHEPMMGYLDNVVCGLTVFLASGRLGCFLVGCCHGLPASCGVRYGEAHARDGFPQELVGVRLFPVQLIEALALAVFGVVCVFFALLAVEGSALYFFLLSYAVLRFGLEAIRADLRPTLLGISQARWMAIAQCAIVVALFEREHPRVTALAILGAICGLLFLGMLGRGLFGVRARALRRSHLQALRDAARTPEGDEPVAVRGPQGFSVAASSGGRIVSVSAPAGAYDLPLLCDVTCAAFPELDVASAVLTGAGILVAELPRGIPETKPSINPRGGFRLFAHLARQAQGGDAELGPRERAFHSPNESRVSQIVLSNTAALDSSPAIAAPEGAMPSAGRQAYFSSVSPPQGER